MPPDGATQTVPARSLFRFPPGDSRTVVIGATGTGKTTFGVWLLAHARFDVRPWIILDYKREELFDIVGSPPLQKLAIGSIPKQKGLYIASPKPGEDDVVEEWLWKIWQRENIGLFCDEATLLPNKDAMKAILRQGRSKRIPIIACTQRPVDIEREFFTEANFVSVFRVQDIRDLKIVQGFIRGLDPDRNLPEHWSYWADVGRATILRLRPCPHPDNVANQLRAAAPMRWFF